MKAIRSMKDIIFEFFIDYVCPIISLGGMYVGLDSLTTDHTIIHVFTSPSAETGVEITEKILTIASLIISIIAGLIPISKHIKRNK